MRLEVKALIKGNFEVSESISTRIHPYDFMIFQEDTDFYISISKKVDHYKDYITKYEIEEDGIPTLTLTPYEIYEDMIQWLQYIESMGAFNIDIESINWEEAQITWIPEADEENNIMPILSFQAKHGKKKDKKIISQSDFSKLIIHRRFLKDLYIPFTYFRHGKNFYNQREYYFAFINFFMMLEYCFARGQFHKKQLLHEFSTSHILKRSISTIMKSIDRYSDKKKKHIEWIKHECVSREKNFDIDGIIYILVEYRGLLSHASKRSDKYLFHDVELFSLAFWTNMICTAACGYLQIGYCLQGAQKEEYLNGKQTRL